MSFASAFSVDSTLDEPFLNGSSHYLVFNSLLAELMLPDGAHQRTEDWTIFYLNQTRATRVNKDLATAEPEHISVDGHEGAANTATRPDLLYVMSLVRTKHGSAYKRSAGRSINSTMGAS